MIGVTFKPQKTFKIGCFVLKKYTKAEKVLRGPFFWKICHIQIQKNLKPLWSQNKLFLFEQHGIVFLVELS